MTQEPLGDFTYMYLSDYYMLTWIIYMYVCYFAALVGDVNSRGTI